MAMQARIRQAIFYGTLGTVACVLAARGLEDGGAFGAAELAAGLATTILAFAVMRAEAEEPRVERVAAQRR